MPSQSQVLIADNDLYYATWVASELQGRLGVPVARVTSGSDAATLMRADPYSACVVNYKLSDMTGLDAIPLLRGRQAGIPIVMTSDQPSDSIAFASLHAGAIEYIPKHKGLAQQLSTLLRQVIDGSYVPPKGSASATPSDVLAPTYQNRLRVIGQELDLRGYRSITLCEVSDGFVACALASGEQDQSALEFLDADFSAFAARAYAYRGSAQPSGQKSSHRLLPTSYSDFLRALGYRLDRERCRAVTICEFPSMIAVTGLKPAGSMADSYSRLEWYLKVGDIRKLVDEAKKRGRTRRA